MKDYCKDEGSVLTAYAVRLKEGLAPEEAQRRLEEKGANRLNDAKKKTLGKRFAEQLLDPMALILAACAVISGFLGEWTDSTVILLVVLLNTVLGIVQESKSEKAIEALQSMTSSPALVRRGGQALRIRSEEVAEGDIVLLEAGDAVPADLRILESAGLKIEESALTGESVPSDKTSAALSEDGGEIPLGDRSNMAYMGSSVVYGRGEGVATATGMRTEMGRIAGTLAKTKNELTPLQEKLNRLSKFLSFAVLGICAFIFLFSLFRNQSFGGEAVLNTFMLAVSLAVAAIPEGLSAVVTIVLSIGMSNMAGQNAIIRKMTAVETLGCTQVICTDKTGTLTQNRMTVEHTYGPAELLAKAAALCSDSRLSPVTGEIVGEPTENALVAYAVKQGLDKNELEKETPRVGESPFDSVRKRMTTVHTLPDGKVVQYTKGAPDVVLDRCTHALRDGKAVPLTEEIRREILSENQQMASRAYRVLMLAEKLLDAVPADFSPEALENGLTFLGLCGMADPVRPEAVQAVRECREAGIRPIMITGDHRDTAAAIARQLGIIQSDAEVLTGSELNSLSDEQLKQTVESRSVYARVQPEHKVRVVQAWKSLGKVTAMTGDGVNDAPALKTADIGVGMGVTGTDVAKNAADMVLADDNFATIVYAVREGRRIYDNIRKSIQFLLSSNLSEVVSIFAATLMGFTLFRPIHILWINLITDSLPAVALGMERAERDVMDRPPRAKGESLFSGGVGFDVLYQGILTATLTLAAYGYGAAASQDSATTMAFLTLSLCEIFHSFNLRARRKSLLSLSSQNPPLLYTLALTLLLTGVLIYTPFLASVFSLVPLTLAQYFASLGFAFCIIPAVELVKAIQRAVKR